VVRLYGGDPFLFCHAAAEAAACVKARVPVEIVPGVPSATAVPAYAGIPLTSDSSGDVRIIHASEVSRLSSGPGSLVILGAEAGPADLGKMLVAAGWKESTPLAITWNGTTTDQQTVVTTLGSVSADLKAAGVSLLTAYGPAIAVVGEGIAAQHALSWFETKPLFGWRILVPRTKEQAESVSDRLRAHGAVPEQVPTIAVEPPRTPQQMERAVKGLVTGRYQWIAFTSVNAVRAVREKFEEYGLDARAFAGVKVAAVGEQTAAALRAFGIMPDLVPDGEQSGEGLADVWPAYDDVLDPINRVLLPRADIATENLLARLTDLGWEAEDVTAYRTVRAAPPPAPIREAIKGGGFDAVLFTSSSTVRNLIGIAGKPHAVTVIAVIGPQTAKTAAEFGLRVDVMAPTPSVTALVDALAEYGAGLREAAVEAGEIVRKPSERRRGARRRIR
jgi:uroporphyrinogen III methyltransferase/synthase